MALYRYRLFDQGVGAMKVQIDTDRCTGHGRCYALSPELFDADDVGYGKVLVDDELPADLMSAAERAVGNCPERAIIVSD
jgi:ferredoxin